MEIFVKYGGMPFWSDFIDQFYDRVTRDSALRDYFVGRNVRRIKEMQLGLLEMTLTGGKFPEDVMIQTHSNLGITKADFDHFLDLYSEALLELGVEQSDITYMMDILVVYRSQVAQGDEE